MESVAREKQYRVAVIGAGVSGLSAAYYLVRQSGQSLSGLHIFEESSEVGGNLKSRSIGGEVHELGAQTLLLSHPQLNELINALSLSDSVIETKSSSRGLLYRKKFVALNPFALLRFGVVSIASLLRVLIEPFVKAEPDRLETAEQFFTRRFGKVFSQRVIRPVLLTMWSGGFEKVIVNFALPKLKELERKFGSVVGGFFVSRFLAKKERSKNSSGALRNGLQTLPITLERFVDDECRKLGIHYSLQTRVCVKDVVFQNDYVILNGNKYDRIIVAVPPWKSQFKINDKLTDLWEALKKIEAQDVVVISLGGIGTPMEVTKSRFGCAAVERESGLSGIVFVHAAYPDHSREDGWLFRLIYGTDSASKLSKMSDTEIVKLAFEFLKSCRLVGSQSTVSQAFLRRVSGAIPLATKAKPELLKKLDEAQKACSQIAFCGAYTHGASVGACVESGKQAALQISQTLVSV